MTKIVSTHTSWLILKDIFIPKKENFFIKVEIFKAQKFSILLLFNLIHDILGQWISCTVQYNYKYSMENEDGKILSTV